MDGEIEPILLVAYGHLHVVVDSLEKASAIRELVHEFALFDQTTPDIA